ncbi:MAG: hypothetical protein ABSB40_12615 [Nitrososphaeria archaeon]|jgi:hypothetical protein
MNEDQGVEERSNAVKSDEDERKPLFTCHLSYVLMDDNNNIDSKGDAQAQLDKQNLSILPETGETLLIPLNDILEISEGDYRIDLYLSSREKLMLFSIGYSYEAFLRTLFELRNEIILKYMLMEEKLRTSGIETEFVYYDNNKRILQKGISETRLYETAIVILPQKGEPVRIPYSDILEIKAEDYTVTLNTEIGESIVFSKMGSQFDLFKKALTEAINQLLLKAQLLLQELAPQVSPLLIRKAAHLMKEGRAAKKSDIESISPELWRQLERKLEKINLKEEYDFLRGISQNEQVSVGFKRGLLGDPKGEYIWFLVAIYSNNPKEPGNAIAMEAVSSAEEGRATYFFRISGRKDYSKEGDFEDLRRKTEDLIRMINHCLIVINFRREPIYLSNDRLDDPEYIKYKISVQKIPQLQTLRDLFIGRVVHLTLDQWKKDTTDLLEFNINTQDDSAKWLKNEKYT